MIYWEVITECDGYGCVERFRTEEEAEAFADDIEEQSDYVRVADGPTQVDTDSSKFFHKDN